MGVLSLRSSISFSLSLHALLALVCLTLLSYQPAVNPRRALTWIDLETVSKAPANKTDLAREERVKNQIVQTQKGQESKVAANDAFLGERTQRVDRQTVSKRQSTADKIGAPKTMAKRPVEASEARKAQDLAQSQEILPLAKLGVPVLPGAMEREKIAKAQEQPRWAEQGSQAEDYVKDLNQSDRTLLNTKEYVFFSYFQRIRTRLDRAWVPILRQKLVRLYRSGRHLASEMDHTTKVVVILNTQGAVVRVKILGQSGNEELDEAAISAFNAAGPFPNPPNGIVDANREIQIPWEFVLKT